MVISASVPLVQDNEEFNTFRTAIRPQTAHALVNAGFRFAMDGSSITAATVVYGAVADLSIRVPAVEDFLVGREANTETLAGAFQVSGVDGSGGVCLYGCVVFRGGRGCRW